jgi:uncharacterized protein (DUF2141 family)
MKSVVALAGGLAVLAASAAGAEPRTVPLTLEIACEGPTRCAGGRFAVAVFREGEGFPDAGRAAASRMVTPAGPVTRVVLEDLPPGRYAIAAFHDADGDGRLSLWPIGLPREAYGFSNDARGRFGPPTFDRAAFTLGPTGARQTLRLR